MSNEKQTTEIKVRGMTCQHCVAAVTKAATSIPGVTDAAVDLEAEMVRVKGTFEREQVIEAIKAAGYEAS